MTTARLARNMRSPTSSPERSYGSYWLGRFRGGWWGLASQFFSHEQMERLRSYPDIGREKLIRFFALTRKDLGFIDNLDRGSDTDVVAGERLPAPSSDWPLLMADGRPQAGSVARPCPPRLAQDDEGLSAARSHAGDHEVQQSAGIGRPIR